MKAKMEKFKPKFEVTLSAEEVVHLEAALDYATKGDQNDVTLDDCFGIFDDHQSDDLMYKLWKGFNKLRDDVLEAGGLDDE